MFETSPSYIEGLATAIAHDTNIKFHSGKGWFSDIKHKELTYDLASLTRMTPLSVKGCILHEVSHLNYTTEVKPSKIAKEYPNMQEVYNTLEDIRIEEKTKEQFGDFAKTGFASVANEAIENHAFHLLGKKPMPRLRQVMLGLLAQNAIKQHYDRVFTNSYLQDDYNMFMENMDKKANTALETLMPSYDWEYNSNSFLDRVYACNNTEEIKTLADNEVYPVIKEFLEDKDMQPQTCQDRQGKGKSKDGQKNKEGKENKEGEEDTGKEGKPNPHATENSPDQKRIPLQLQDIMSDKELDSFLAPYISTLAHRLINILRERKATRYTGAYLQGKLLSKNSFKVVMGENRIFSKRNNPNEPHYTISLLLDESGSMGASDGRLANTYIASYLLTKTVQKMGFKLNLIAYDSNPRVLKTISDYRKIRGGGNEESKALKMVGELTNPQEDNIVLMLTDGGFCEEEEILKNAIQKLTLKNYEVIGVGVGLDSRDSERLKQGYPVALNAPNVKELPQLMISLLKGLIHR